MVLFQIETHKVDWKVGSRVGSLDNATHKPGGGDKKVGRKIICDTILCSVIMFLVNFCLVVEF